MKKDIEIPQVEGVYLAAVHEEHEEFKTHDWNVYLINDRKDAVESVLIVSKGYDEKRQTSTMRHSLKVLPAKSYAKVEFLQEEVLTLNNEFSVSFFADGKMFHKNYIFKKNTVNERGLRDLPLMSQKGILLK